MCLSSPSPDLRAELLSLFPEHELLLEFHTVLLCDTALVLLRVPMFSLSFCLSLSLVLFSTVCVCMCACAYMLGRLVV